MPAPSNTSSPSANLTPLQLAKAKLDAAKAVEEAAKAAAKEQAKADKQAAKQAERGAAPLKAKSGKPRVVAAPPPPTPTEDDDFIDDDEGDENGLEESDDPRPGVDDDEGEDPEEDEEEGGDDTGEDTDPAPAKSAHATPRGAAPEAEPKRRGRPSGTRGQPAPLDPALDAVLGKIPSLAARKVVKVVGSRLFSGLRGRQAAVEAAVKSQAREAMLEALATMEAAFDNLVNTAMEVPQDWTLRRASSQPQREPAWTPTPGTLVYLNPAFADAFGDFMEVGVPGKVVKILPGHSALILAGGAKIPMPFAVLMPDED